MKMSKVRSPCFYFFFVGWDCMSLGIHVDLLSPNVEIHLPFGFIKFGWEKRLVDECGNFVFPTNRGTHHGLRK